MSVRLEILTTLCYHHNYLDITKLRSQYDATMKRVECRQVGWSATLAEHLYSDLTLRATILGREHNKRVK